jgi:hypothetical protein
MFRRTSVLAFTMAAAMAVSGVASTAAGAAPHRAHAPSVALPTAPPSATAPLRRAAHVSRRRVSVPRRDRRRGGRRVARAASFSNAWFGSGAACVGTATTLSVGRNFGLAPGTYFSWRSRLRIYDPRTGAQFWSSWSGSVSDRVTTTSYLLPDGTFILGASGGINPAPSPSITWTVSRGLYVMPYAEVIGYGERPVNYGYVAPPNGFAQPNWCYVA